MNVQKEQPTARVAVVMATYNGRRFIQEQIDSIVGQQGVDVRLFVYDDGSTDGTPEVVRALLTDSTKDRIVLVPSSENVGFPTSFFNALAACDDDFDFYAYADQDDVWLPDKLSVAVNALRHAAKAQLEDPASLALLYVEPTTAVNEDLDVLFERRMVGLRPTLRSFFVRARVAAHTMVFTGAIRDDLLTLGRQHHGFSHGWLALLVASARCAPIITGARSHTLHRRLRTSVSAGGKGVVDRLRSEWGATFHPKVDRAPMARDLLAFYGERLQPADTDFLRALAAYRGSWHAKRKLLHPSNFCSDVTMCNVEGWLAGFFNRY